MSLDESIELWKEISEAPAYEVSSWGRVRSRKGRRPGRAGGDWMIRAPSRLPNGYMAIKLYTNGRYANRYVHRLVLAAFVGPCPPGCQARHVVENDRSNNRVENLAWGTAQQNSDDKARHGTQVRGSDAHASKLTEEDVGVILTEASSGVPVKELAERHGIRKENMSKIVNGHHWAHVGGKRKPHRDSLPGYIDTEEAGKILGVTRERVQQLIKRGDFPAVRCRKGLMVEKAAVDAADLARRCG